VTALCQIANESMQINRTAACQIQLWSQCSIALDPPAQTLHGSSKAKTLADRYEYVMHGKIFKYRTTNAGGQLRVEVTISFGGLLLQMVGDATKLEGLELDTFIFLLIRKV
jgi:RNA polymerase Rpb8